jgi:hypothetical protein
MKKRSTGESDELNLKRKIAVKVKDDQKLSGDLGVRSLRKRLKRVQRKRRAISSRKKHAAGKQVETKS